MSGEDGILQLNTSHAQLRKLNDSLTQIIRTKQPGPLGSDGSKGSRGQKGQKGDRGIKGEQGDRGMYIKFISLVSLIHWCSLYHVRYFHQLFQL